MLRLSSQIAAIAVLLIVGGLGLTLYKSLSLGLPLLPSQYQDVWTIESKIAFAPGQGPVDVSLILPQADTGWVILNENFSSSGFGFTVTQDGSDRQARWTRASLQEPATLYYKMQVYKTTDTKLPDLPAELPPQRASGPSYSKAMTGYIDNLREKSTDDENFTRLMLQEFYAENLNQEVQFILSGSQDTKLEQVLRLLRQAGIPAHRIRGIELEDGRRRQTLSAVLEIHNGKRWVVMQPNDGSLGLPHNFYVWKRGDDAILSVSGGEDSTLQFALVENSIPQRTLVSMEAKSEQFALLDFSIYSLPVEQQGIFKGLLLIPVAALVVVFMRIFVGLSTSGTFMPILIALAFIQTTLLVGLAIFLIVVSVGLWIRSYLSHGNLLLVARVASVVIVVILLMAVIAVASYKLGIDQALTVTFFPTIILAWTIERMSILWEEEGVHEVVIQGGGSLLVAVLAYLVMSNKFIEHLTFNFPELLFSLLGVILLMGKYTGYRLSELYRFREMRKRT